ncbi:MAG: carbamoyl-phosphate-synthetase [Fibrobacterota bacterium]|nr:carbamoyl-phosphate-synthetase [Fibrobacterota bacterium]QQS03820.1 MAG: carbamoyl-phosphate-synthetase [Fibrobacterota bacterium]
MKKLLVLGASPSQIPMIERAKELGIRVFTCDNRPSNPGHKLAHASFDVDIVDKPGVLRLVRELGVDGVICTSDLAAPTAAWVCEQANLPTNPYESVLTLCDKSRFRAFQRRHGFRCPAAEGFSKDRIGELDLSKFRLPVIVKPVDSSGSRGVKKVEHPSELAEAIEFALGYSPKGEFIVEDFLVDLPPPMSGDGFSWKGKLAFRSFNNDTRDPAAPYVAVALTIPFRHTLQVQDRMHLEIQRLFDLLDMQSGVYNFDVRIDSEGEPVIMEIGPRAGSHGIPQITKLATGVDLTTLAIQAAIGEDLSHVHMEEQRGAWASYAINSLVAGKFRSLEIDPEFRASYVVDIMLTVQPGEEVAAFSSSTGILGILLLRFGSSSECEEKIAEIRRWVRVEVD